VGGGRAEGGVPLKRR